MNIPSAMTKSITETLRGAVKNFDEVVEEMQRNTASEPTWGDGSFGNVDAILNINFQGQTQIAKEASHTSTASNKSQPESQTHVDGDNVVEIPATGSVTIPAEGDADADAEAGATGAARPDSKHDEIERKASGNLDNLESGSDGEAEAQQERMKSMMSAGLQLDLESRVPESTFDDADREIYKLMNKDSFRRWRMKRRGSQVNFELPAQNTTTA